MELPEHAMHIHKCSFICQTAPLFPSDVKIFVVVSLPLEAQDTPPLPEFCPTQALILTQGETNL